MTDGQIDTIAAWHTVSVDGHLTIADHRAFARAIIAAARNKALESAMQSLYDAKQFEAYEVVYKILRDQQCSK